MFKTRPGLWGTHHDLTVALKSQASFFEQQQLDVASASIRSHSIQDVTAVESRWILVSKKMNISNKKMFITHEEYMNIYMFHEVDRPFFKPFFIGHQIIMAFGSHICHGPMVHSRGLELQ